MGREGDLSDFDGVVIVAIQASLSVSETAERLGFSHTTVLQVWERIVVKNENSGSSGGENAMLMPEDRGRCPGFSDVERKQ